MPPVRETRHLWVGNIPDGTTEEKLIEYFQRYGRIDSVKILAKRSLDGGQAAFVDFVDIRCAIKAHETPNRLGDRELRTDYNEPASSTLTRSQGETGRRYDRGGRGPGDEGYSSRQTEAFQGNYTYKDDGPGRSRDDDGPARSRDDVGPARSRDDDGPARSRDDVGPARSRDDDGPARSRDDVGPARSRDDVGPARSRDDVGPARSRDDVGPARSRDYERADGGERNTTRATEENPGPYHRQNHQPGKGKDSDSGQSGSGTALSGSGSDSSDSGDSDSDTDSDSSPSENSRGGKKTTALQIRNLSSRPTDATIREGLYHEFKKHGEVGQIKVFGRESNRYAVVYFRRHEHVMKAMESCREKMFLGVEMELTPHTDDHYEGSFHRYRRHNEAGSSSFGTADDVYLFNATRTIFVGNFERNTNANELKKLFERYGEIVDIDIKKQGSNGAYAFIQYLDITHAVEAKKQMNRVLSGRNRLKIGFGKGMPTSTIWLGGLPLNITEQMLERQFQRYGRINRVGLDQQRSYAMVTFDNIDGSTVAHNEAKDRPAFGKRIRVDYASRESQHFFYDYLARTGQGDGRRYEPSPPPPSFRPRAKYDDIRSRTGPKQDNRGSKYHGYDHGYERGPAFNEGGRGRGHYDDYYRGSAGGGGGYESDDFGQELREYNVTRERERERERAREREQDRRQEPPPRRRHHREPARHEANTENDDDGERYYSRGEHSDVWPPGDSGKDRASRESSVEPRDESHRRGDKRRDGDKRKTEPDKRGHVKVKYDEQSEEDMEPSVKQPADKKERRDKVYRKKPTEPREEAAKPEFYPTSYEKGYGNGDGKEKVVTVKRKVKVKEHPEGTLAVEGKIRPEEVTVKVENVRVENVRVENVREEKVRRIDKEERIAEKIPKKIKHKDGKKKRKHKKSPEIIPPVETPTASNLSRHVDSDGATEGVAYESRGNRLESRVEKRTVTTAEEGREERKVIKSMIVQKPVPENAERDRRDYREERRPRSPSPEDAEVHVPRKRPRSPEYDAEHSRAKNAKHAESSRHSNGNHYDDAKPKKERTPREATPPPPPPPPPPYNHSSKPKPVQNDPRQLAKVSSASRESSVAAPPKTGGYLAPTRPSRDMTFKPQVTEPVLGPSSGGTAKHVTSEQTSGHPSPTNSPAPAQTGSSTVPNSDDTLMELLRRHPVMWQGLLGLKNDSAAIQMHYVSGNSKLAEYSLPKPGEGTGPNGLAVPPVLRIAQRMRMEASQLEGVTKRMQLDKEHCLLLALPCGRDPLDVHAQTRALKNGFIAYLQQKLAAGIINIAQPGSQQASFVLHVFPPCEFTHSHLSRVAPNLLDSATDSGHLMVVVATV